MRRAGCRTGCLTRRGIRTTCGQRRYSSPRSASDLPLNAVRARCIFVGRGHVVQEGAARLQGVSQCLEERCQARRPERSAQISRADARGPAAAHSVTNTADAACSADPRAARPARPSARPAALVRPIELNEDPSGQSAKARQPRAAGRQARAWMRVAKARTPGRARSCCMRSAAIVRTDARRTSWGAACSAARSAR